MLCINVKRLIKFDLCSKAIKTEHKQRKALLHLIKHAHSCLEYHRKSDQEQSTACSLI